MKLYSIVLATLMVIFGCAEVVGMDQKREFETLRDQLSGLGDFATAEQMQPILDKMGALIKAAGRKNIDEIMEPGTSLGVLGYWKKLAQRYAGLDYAKAVKALEEGKAIALLLNLKPSARELFVGGVDALIKVYKSMAPARAAEVGASGAASGVGKPGKTAEPGAGLKPGGVDEDALVKQAKKVSQEIGVIGMPMGDASPGDLPTLNGLYDALGRFQDIVVQIADPRALEDVFADRARDTYVDLYQLLATHYATLDQFEKAKAILRGDDNKLQWGKLIANPTQEVRQSFKDWLEQVELMEKNASAEKGNPVPAKLEAGVKPGEAVKPEEPVRVGSWHVLETREEAQKLMKEAQQLASAKEVDKLTEQEISAIDAKYNEVINLLISSKNNKEIGLDLLANAYKSRIDFYGSTKRFGELLSYVTNLKARIGEDIRQLKKTNWESVSFQGYDAKAHFEEYQKLKTVISEAQEEAKKNLKALFGQIVSKLEDADMRTLETSIDEFNQLKATVNFIDDLDGVIDDFVKPYLQANLKIVDFYLNAKNLEALNKIFKTSPLEEIISFRSIAKEVWPDAQKEFTKRYSDYKTLEQAPKKPEPDKPAPKPGNDNALRDALQGLANALNGVRGNL